MDNVSRPMQALLLATVAFAALWFVALRPKPPESSGAPAAPAATTAPAPAPQSAIPGGPGSAVDQAREARSKGDAAAAARSGEPVAQTPPQPVATPARAPAAAQPKPKPKPARATGAPAGVKRALARGKVVVLLFYSPAASDDRLVRDEVAGVSRRRGRVYVKSVRVSRLSRYREVLAGVQVLQTPSVVMLRRGRDPVLLAGYTDGAEMDQISAALLRKRRPA
ncbi:MAG TPA: hypothetical protein VNB64_03370 [Solirubrobacteraceae bacterium]|nr:hypothetical protein [Solirubrobacteraceae bacterium]